MIQKIVIFAPLLLITVSCSNDRAVGKTKEDVLFSCYNRLDTRTKLSISQVENFCGCFVDEALKKYSIDDLSEEMSSGSNDAFKGTLKGEFEQCKTRM